MEPIENSLFLDGRTIEFVTKLLPNSRVAPSPFSQFEIKLLRNRDHVRELDRALEKGLIATLTHASRAMTVNTCLRFLLYAQQHKLLEDAQRIIEIAHRDESILDAEGLKEILSQRDELDIALLIPLYSIDHTDRVVKDREAQGEEKRPLWLPKNL